MRHKFSHTPLLFLVTAGVTMVGVVCLGFLAYKQNKHINQLTHTLTTERSLSDAAQVQSTATITALEEELLKTKQSLATLTKDYRDEKDRNDEFEDEISDLASTIEDIRKLESIDQELLQKYSKVYFLNENYQPTNLTKINEEFVQANKSPQYFHGDAYRHLENMLERAERAGHDLQVISAYRSFDEQNALKNQFTQIFGEGANTFSADQGFSEHQLGTAVDLTIPSIGATEQSFGNTEAFAWLQANAYKYGFILSYPEGNDFYIYEPWHWRFVGRDLARHLDRSDETFYTLDQREIDTYLLEFFD